MPTITPSVPSTIDEANFVVSSTGAYEFIGPTIATNRREESLIHFCLYGGGSSRLRFLSCRGAGLRTFAGALGGAGVVECGTLFSRFRWDPKKLC